MSLVRSGASSVALGVVAVLCSSAPAQTTSPAAGRTILPAIFDLDIAEERPVTLCDGRTVHVRLIEVKATRDAIRGAVRRADVTVEVNGARADLVCANYRLPVAIGNVQIDCPATRDYVEKATVNFWAIQKRARLRLWPAGSPLLEPGSFGYPVRQRWFASDTQMGNDPCYVGGETFLASKIYYHSGLDFGGCEGLVDIVSATDGLVVSAGDDVLPDHKHDPVQPRYDRVHILDGRGWYLRYSHLKTVDPLTRLGGRVRIGEKLGVLGKEGTSGGWSHLHFEIFSLMAPGQYGSQDAYAYAWEAWQREAKPRIIAVARPHLFARTGDRVTLDGSRSWSAAGPVARYDWTLSNGRTASGPLVEAGYERPGCYSEILKVTDAAGRVAYDFAVVEVVDFAQPKDSILGINATFAPTQGARAHQPVTFKVRTFNTTAGEENWDFGDGTPPATTHSDGNVKALNPDGYAVLTHAFAASGDYIVSVTRSNALGMPATARLWVQVE